MPTLCEDFIVVAGRDPVGGAGEERVVYLDLHGDRELALSTACRSLGENRLLGRTAKPNLVAIGIAVGDFAHAVLVRFL